MRSSCKLQRGSGGTVPKKKSHKLTTKQLLRPEHFTSINIQRPRTWEGARNRVGEKRARKNAGPKSTQCSLHPLCRIRHRPQWAPLVNQSPFSAAAPECTRPQSLGLPCQPSQQKLPQFRLYALAAVPTSTNSGWPAQARPVRVSLAERFIGMLHFVHGGIWRT